MLTPILIKMVIDYIMQEEKELYDGILLIAAIVSSRLLAALFQAQTQSNLVIIFYF
jgi:hypothetical protein